MRVVGVSVEPVERLFEVVFAALAGHHLSGSSQVCLGRMDCRKRGAGTFLVFVRGRIGFMAVSMPGKGCYPIRGPRTTCAGIYLTRNRVRTGAIEAEESDGFLRFVAMQYATGKPSGGSQRRGWSMAMPCRRACHRKFWGGSSVGRRLCRIGGVVGPV